MSAQGIGFMGELNGDPTLLGTLTSTGSAVTEASTAVPFTIPKGKVLLLQVDAAGYFITSGAPDSAATTVTATNGIYLAANERYVLGLRDERASLSWISATGTAKCRVFQLK